MNKQTILSDLNDLYRAGLTAQQLRLHIQALDGMTDEECHAAAKELMRTSTFMPRPAELWAIVNDRRRATHRHRIHEQQVVMGRPTDAVRRAFNVPDGVSIMRYIEQLREQGMTPDEIANSIVTGP